LKAAIEAETTQNSASGVSRSSLLVIENLTQLQTRRVAQQELIHSLDAVVDQGGQVVVTSHTAPERIANLSPDLCSRLAAGLTVPLMAPAAATRLVIIERLAELRSIPITTPAARALADGLNGIRARTTRRAVATGCAIATHVGFGRRYFGRCRRHRSPHDRNPRRSTMARGSAIAAATELAHDCQASGEVFWAASRRTDQSVAATGRRAARAIAMYLGRQLTAKSLEQLGKHFGGRDQHDRFAQLPFD